MLKRKNKVIFSAAAFLTVFALTAFGSIEAKAAGIPDEVTGNVDQEGLKSVYDTLFSQNLEKEDATVVTPEAAGNIPVAMTRLSNGKIAYTVNGQPFFPLGIETGWWDTRVDDNGKMSSNSADVGDDFKKISDQEWNAYFADMKNMGFNTVQLMIYWEDWEPEQGRYDFTFLDHVTGLAAEKGMKTEFIIFFHSQTDNIPRIKENFWGYNADNMEVGGKKYALSMQWGDNLTSAEDIRKYRDDHGNGATGIENFLEYWHPEVFRGITNALTALGEHYKDSANIVGYQIGNEEGFNFYVDSGDDKNPYYSELYNYWQADPQNAGKTKDQFRAETVNNLWKCFNNALHTGDPYKPTTTNIQGGNTEKQNIKDNRYSNDGTTMDFYKSVDMIGTMFYGGASAIYTNLDATYQNADKTAYATGFPVLFPTEISGTMNNGNVAKIITAQTIARGGQGVGIYCYGELYNNFEQNQWSSPKPVMGTVKTMLSTLHDTQDVFWSAVPVTQGTTDNLFMTIQEVRGIADAAQGSPEVSVLQSEDGKALGVLHFWGNSNNAGADANAERTVVLNITAKQTGNYKVKLHKTDGTIEVRGLKAERAGTAVPLEVTTTGSDVTYIVVEKTTEELPAGKEITGIELLTLPNKVFYTLEEGFDSQGLSIRVRYSDGSAEVLGSDAVEVSQPDMSTEGQKEITVGYQGYQTTFLITVQEAKYTTNLKDAADTGDSLARIFDRDTSTTGGFIANDEDLVKMANGECYIQYNFDKKMLMKGVSLTTNYAADQAILSFKLAVLAEDGTWQFLEKQRSGQFDLNWETNVAEMETHQVSVEPYATTKVRLYVMDAANRWTDNFGHGNHKFEMAEIQFQTEELPEITGIYVKNQPEKLEYAIGEELDTTGITVMAVYSDTTEEDVTNQVTFSGYDAAMEGQQNVSVSYQDKWTASYAVEVCRTDKLIVIPPNKTVYNVGEKLDVTGMQVFSQLPSGRKIQVPLESVTIAPVDFSAEGETVIRVTYQGAAAEFKVTVLKPVTPNQNPGDNNQGSNPPNKAPNVPDQKPSADQAVKNPVQAQKVNAVKTGDETADFAWAGLMAVSAGVLLAAGVWRRFK